MKTCTKCKVEKQPSEFQKRKASNDGLTASCKACLKLYDDARLNAPHRMKARRDYQKTEKGKVAHNNATKKWVEKNAIKRGVHIITGNAIRDGKLTKAKCESCGDKKVNAHHDDYAKPLRVRWLCDTCHNIWHKINGEGKNAN